MTQHAVAVAHFMAGWAACGATVAVATVLARAGPSRRSRHFGAAWVALSLSLAAHVVDEAMTGFLDVYNPIVRSLRERFAWFPMPVFTFDVWLGGLCAVVIVLLALSPLAFRRSRLVRLLAYPYAAIMLLNGIGHLAGSVYLGRWAPGATTAPLLIATSVWLFVASRAIADGPVLIVKPERRVRP
jgi:hypothetical protein